MDCETYASCHLLRGRFQNREDIISTMVPTLKIVIPHTHHIAMQRCGTRTTGWNKLKRMRRTELYKERAELCGMLCSLTLLAPPYVGVLLALLKETPRTPPLFVE